MAPIVVRSARSTSQTGCRRGASGDLLIPMSLNGMGALFYPDPLDTFTLFAVGISLFRYPGNFALKTVEIRHSSVGQSRDITKLP